MKQRLMELLNDYCIDVDIGSWEKETLADYLINSGVIVLPVKVGQTVYVPWRWDDQRGVAYVEVDEINFYDSKMNYMFLIDMASDDESYNQAFGGWKDGMSIGKTVFLTQEEADKALAEGGENDTLTD